MRAALSEGRGAIVCGAGVSYEAAVNLPLAVPLINMVGKALLDDIAKYVRIDVRPEVFFEIVARTCPRDCIDSYQTF